MGLMTRAQQELNKPNEKTERKFYCWDLNIESYILKKCGFYVL